MNAYEELFEKGIDQCPECGCAIDIDWEYKDYSSKTVVICPQCKTEINLETINS